MLRLLFITFVFVLSSEEEKMYVKQSHDNGKLKEEGWVQMNNKIGYWKFYHANGKLQKEGHYQNNLPEKYWYFYASNGQKTKEGHFQKGKKSDWWLFYDEQGRVNHKCQLKDDVKNGYCLKYKDEKLTSAEKYTNGKKIDEWFDFRSFKRDNNLRDLRSGQH